MSELHVASVSKRVLVQNVSYENEFDLHENEITDETQFQNNGLARTLVLTQRQRATREWPIITSDFQSTAGMQSTRSVL